jgi:hypothetical protein
MKSGCIGARGILIRNYDWMRVAFTSNENASDNPVFSCSQLVPAVDGDSSCVAILVEVLVKGEATEFLSLLGSDAKEVMLIDECGGKRWRVVRLNI